MINTNAVLTSPTGAKKIGLPTTGDLPEVKGPQMNIRDHYNDLLIGEKHLSSTYGTSLAESIQPDLCGLFAQMRDRAIDCQWRLFEKMYSMGEYQADLSPAETIRDVSDVFSGYRVQLPYGADGTPTPLK